MGTSCMSSITSLKSCQKESPKLTWLPKRPKPLRCGKLSRELLRCRKIKGNSSHLRNLQLWRTRSKLARSGHRSLELSQTRSLKYLKAPAMPSLRERTSQRRNNQRIKWMMARNHKTSKSKVTSHTLCCLRTWETSPGCMPCHPCNTWCNNSNSSSNNSYRFRRWTCSTIKGLSSSWRLISLWSKRSS
jgi:hypothetical protein